MSEQVESIPKTNALLELIQTGQLALSLESGELRFLSAKRTAEKAGFSVATLHRAVGAGDFPQPVKVGDTMVRWVSTEVDAWICQRVAEHRRESSRRSGSKGGLAKAKSYQDGPSSNNPQKNREE